jgi:hypothetical protein
MGKSILIVLLLVVISNYVLARSPFWEVTLFEHQGRKLDGGSILYSGRSHTIRGDNITCVSLKGRKLCREPSHRYDCIPAGDSVSAVKFLGNYCVKVYRSLDCLGIGKVLNFGDDCAYSFCNLRNPNERPCPPGCDVLNDTIGSVSSCNYPRIWEEQ